MQPALARTIAAAAVAALLCPAAASAQTFDHLKCYKVKDTRTFRSADVDLEAEMLAEFGLQSCTVKGRAKEVCVAVDKTVTAIDDGSVQTIPGTFEGASRVCYKLKCPKVFVPPVDIADQFGTREAEGFRVGKLCTPAYVGSIPTTTTTTTTLPAGDTFDGASLDPSWLVHNPALVSIDVSGGYLNIVPTMAGTGTTWFNDSEGPLIYKQVTGDFDVRTVIETEEADTPANAAPPQYRLAGLLARDPASTAGDYDWVHVALGSGSAGQGTSYEYKSTLDSVSTWATTPTPSPDGELRLVRTGSVFDLYWRPDAISSWTMINSFDRPDMPATLDVGMMIYSTDAPPDIRGRFDLVEFF